MGYCVVSGRNFFMVHCVWVLVIYVLFFGEWW